MTCSQRIVAALLCVLCVTGFSVGAEVGLPKPGHKWIEVRTANFRFFSNASKAATRRVAVDLEELRAVLGELTEFELQSPIPTYIYVFKHDRSFEPYKNLYRGQPAAVSGYFANRESANYIAINADSSDASNIIFHEYVHYVSDTNLWYLPVWLEEGLAEFYATFEVVSDTVYLGLPDRRHLATLNNSTVVPFETLLTVDHDSPLYNEKDRKGDFYAQSWALVHYMLLGNTERRQQLESYLARIRVGMPPGQAFSESFGTDYKTLEQEVRNHLRGPRFPIVQTRAEIDIDDSLEVREMPYAEVLFRLGDLLANQIPERPEAIEYFEAAVRTDPEHARALSALALEAEARAKWDTAGSYHRRAARADPDDALVLFRWGEFLGRRGNQVSQALDVLNRSARLDPTFAPTWAVLTTVYADAGVISKDALRAAETAHRLLPANEEISVDLLRLYLRLDQRESAVALVETALRNNPHAKKQAWTLVLQNDFLRARELLRNGHADQALARIDLTEAASEHSSQPEFIRREIASTRRMIMENEAAKLCDHAEELFENDDPEGARKVLHEALLAIESGPVAEACRRLLDHIDHPTKYQPAPLPTVSVSPTAEEIEELNRLLASNDLEGALDFLTRIRENSFGAQQRWLDSKIAEVERNVEYNRYVDSYNRAVDLINRGDYADAIELLEKLLSSLPEGPKARSTRALLEDARTKLANS
jgi:tetratricopeptide (TPR) repeat protein